MPCEKWLFDLPHPGREHAADAPAGARPVYRSPKRLGTLQKYDVVLYRRPSDPYVLHRIIEVRPDSYVILGDNCIAKEYGIRDEDILGVLTSFQHNGHTVSVSDWRYRLYSRGWVFFQPVRIFCKRVKGKLHR